MVQFTTLVSPYTRRNWKYGHESPHVLAEKLEDCLLQGTTSLEIGRAISNALWEGTVEVMVLFHSGREEEATTGQSSWR